MSSDNNNQSLTRGLKIVEFLSDYANGCQLAEIADGTGINKSTTHRLLKSLQALGYVANSLNHGSYRLTSKFMAIGYKTFSCLNIIHIATPHLEHLNLITGDTVKLSTRENYRSVLIYLLEPRTGMFRTRSYIGQSHRFYCSGMGKTYLAFSPENFLDEYWEKQKEHIVRYTSNTIVNKEVMRQELQRIRAERISYDRGENEIDISCIASPVFSPDNRVDYAISVTVPTSRLDDRKRMELADLVKETAEKISLDYGWPGDVPAAALSSS